MNNSITLKLTNNDNNYQYQWNTILVPGHLCDRDTVVSASAVLYDEYIKLRRSITKDNGLSSTGSIRQHQFNYDDKLITHQSELMSDSYWHDNNK